MRKVTVFITLKQGVLDPQGNQVQESLQSLGYNVVQDVRIGKYIELLVEDGPDLEVRIQEMCDKLLVNPVMEDYYYEVKEDVHS
ncbi:phosphoribosylformylglycinamidine synthase subunit PurS [Ornithinibacillus bavariensis]|uniref:Phosphoribosylformylglycinamidine synthase subunit PurS n=1 Tax=Ornithinibacillus bavariensis TaxID=545502 RepID=A0A920C7U0_9BACI|nr:phosphoribosylformylglycinamidine synthase subunit PurS [Ornithinibacillus bavariensis]GIO28018.1 phosphoribosylformylglycinamidine synthase subunit PurS [Ornithinibacillus bavariensis]